MSSMRLQRRIRGAIAAFALSAPVALHAQQVPSPAAHFGFEIGADRKLADWSALTAYFERLAETSDRVVVDTLGPTTAGRPFVMLTITSPENHDRLGRRAVAGQEVRRGGARNRRPFRFV